MKSYEFNMRCKDFDSWISFLGRLNKIGTNYIIKNDIILATYKRSTKKTDEKIPGKHVIRDPLALDYYDFQEFCEPDSVFVMHDITTLLNEFEQIQDKDKLARKSIIYFRTKGHIGINLGSYQVIIAEVLNLDLKKRILDVFNKEFLSDIEATANSIGWFDDLIQPVEEAENNDWYSFTEKDLIRLRNNELLRISSKVDNTLMSAKLARSLFYMAGVTRTDTPIAEAVRYAFLPSDQSDVAILRIHAKYKCGQNALIVVNCIHEYLSLIYDDGKGLGEQ